jgi:hypothetical protein
LEKEDIKILGRHAPTDFELKEADEVFGKILKDKNPKSKK